MRLRDAPLAGAGVVVSPRRRSIPPPRRRSAVSAEVQLSSMRSLAGFRLLVALSSFLLFQVELIVGRLLLPSFGSSAAVWSTCLFFFQGALFLGYLYADRISPWIAAGRYRWQHVVIAALAALALPMRVVSIDAPPILAILFALMVAVAAPFLVLSTTSVVAQGWFLRSGHPRADDPYFLYGTSNAGALLALVTYPLLLEPLLELHDQLTLWYAGYALFVALHLLCLPKRGEEAPKARAPASPVQPPLRDKLRWLSLSAGGSALLVAVSAAVGVDAPLPLLWMLPLAVFLTTLIVAFARRPPDERQVSLLALGALVLAAVAVAFVQFERHVQAAYVAVHSLLLFVGCMLAHSHLARARPADARQLGSYYLILSLGGWLGAAVISLGVPVLFADVPLPHLEYGLALVLLVGALAIPAKAGPPGAGRRRLVNLAAAAIVGVGIVAWSLHFGDPGRALWFTRTFYGTYSVADRDGLRWLHHGNTVHGVEARDEARRGQPLGYYHPGSPIAGLLAVDGPARDVGVIGLGVGTLAAYERPGEAWHFFEIDPAVQHAATQYFTHLARARGETRVVIGDARLTLAAVPDGSFDLIVVDAFASDFVPLHLVSLEAIALYERKLRKDGRIVFHTTNRLFDFVPVLARAGHALGLQTASAEAPTPTAQELAHGVFASSWVALQRREQAAGPPAGWTEVVLSPAEAARRPWTDAYVNLFHALRF